MTPAVGGEGESKLVATDLGSGRYRFAPEEPTHQIDPMTVIVADDGTGTVELLLHDGNPMNRELVLESRDSASFIVQHGEQGAGDYEFTVAGVKRINGVEFEALSVRFTI